MTKDSPTRPLVSIITVVYNGETYIKDTIDSVKSQNYSNIEYIIIDAESTDRTPSIIRESAPTNTIWVREPDNGIYDGMNKGISLAQGEIIALLNADDWYEPEAVSRVVQEMSRYPELYLVYGAMIRRGPDNNIVSIYGSKEHIPDILSAPFNHPTCFVRREAYDQTGLFNCKYPTAADYDWILRFKSRKLPYTYIDEKLTNFRLSGVTGSNQHPPYKQIYSILRKNKISSPKAIFALLFRLSLVFSSQLKSATPARIQKKIKSILTYQKF